MIVDIYEDFDEDLNVVSSQEYVTNIGTKSRSSCVTTWTIRKYLESKWLDNIKKLLKNKVSTNSEKSSHRVRDSLTWNECKDIDKKIKQNVTTDKNILSDIVLQYFPKESKMRDFEIFNERIADRKKHSWIGSEHHPRATHPLSHWRPECSLPNLQQKRSSESTYEQFVQLTLVTLPSSSWTVSVMNFLRKVRTENNYLHLFQLHSTNCVFLVSIDQKSVNIYVTTTTCDEDRYVLAD